MTGKNKENPKIVEVNPTTKPFSFSLADIEREVEAKAAKRAQRRKELFDKDIAADVRIVAWVDILGFSHQLQEAKTNAQYRAAYHKMLFVHEEFDSPTASDEPDEQERINKEFGRNVFALSDGLVVTASANAEARVAMTPYDLLMSFIGEILMAQANCALNGIFLRGGISIGPFYYEDNILLSPALVRAYKLETEHAVYPIIIVEQKNIAALRELKGFKHYAKDAEPSQSYFQPLKLSKQEKGEQFFYLDYLNFLADPGNYGFFCDADRKAYSDSEKNSPRKRDRIFKESHRKSAAKAMYLHKEKLVRAYQEATIESVREKYRWLMACQNKTLEGYPAVYNKARIDIKRIIKL